LEIVGLADRAKHRPGWCVTSRREILTGKPRMRFSICCRY
jgi:hypothetical protein